MSLREYLKEAGLGKVVYHLWHRPTGKVRDVIAAGGPIEVRRTEQGRQAMKAAAKQLPPIEVAGKPIELHLLTGARFWEQTAFCLWSFARQSGQRVHPVIYDDGTLTTEFRAPLARLFPSTIFVDKTATIQRLDQYLPMGKYPVLRERWLNYPNIRKLTDVHCGSSGWKLVIDSDLLFFRRPTFLLDWLAKPDRPLHAVDCETSYGYSRPLMNRLSGRRAMDLVNVGLTGLHSESIDWERLEFWTRELQVAENTSYYLEQALIAMMVSDEPCAIAPAKDYITMPAKNEVSQPTAIMHHYVAQSKRWYFRHGWRNAAGISLTEN